MKLTQRVLVCLALLLAVTGVPAQNQQANILGVLRLRVRVKADDAAPMRGLARKRFFLIPGTLEQNRALINAIEHGGHSDPQLRVSVTYVRGSRSIIYYLRDPGAGFSFDAIPHAAVSSPGDPVKHIQVREARGMRAGGFGILLTRNFADELIYSEKGNEVMFVKYLNGGKRSEQ